MIWGGPGIGKSEIPEQVAREMGVPLIDFRANLFDPVDVRGIPYIKQIKETGKRFTSWAVPDVFPIAERDGERGILFIDELPPHHQQRRMHSCNCCSTDVSATTSYQMAGRLCVLVTD